MANGRPKPSAEKPRALPFVQRLEDPATWATKIPFFYRLSVKEKIFFFKYLSVMTDAGIPLEKSLIAIHNQAKGPVMHRVLHVMLNATASGEFVSTSMRKMPHIFEKLVVSLVSVGETSGTLTQELFRIAEHLEKARDLRTKVLTALLYPAILVVGTVGVTAYMLFVLIPQLLPLFVSLDVDLPLTTKIVIAASEILTRFWIAIVAAVAAVFGGFVLGLRRPTFRYGVERFVLAVPFVGQMYLKVQVAQFTRIVGTLLTSGLTIVEAMTIAAESMDNLVYQRALVAIAAEIQGGNSVSSYLAQHPGLFPPFITQMIGVGEETGKLDETFLFVANFAEREVDDMTRALATTLEPLLMVVMGGIVGFIAIAVITPIYQLTTGLSQ